jgi:peptidoglycan/LPS O-acetylase OafA/YrhL
MLIVCIVVGLIIFDVVAYQGEPGATLSEVLRDSGPWGAFATGVLAAHFHIQLAVRRLPHWLCIAVLCALSLAVARACVLLQPPPWDSLMALVTGLVCGATVWPLERRKP